MHDLYRAILESTSNNDHVEAGHRHEAIWLALLRRTDVRVHNVRLSGGDGGIDGVAFKDSTANEAVMYQAKFFKDITTKEHRAAVLKSFVAAHQHEFQVVRWVLLIPFEPSQQELNWLQGGGLKDEAKTKFTGKGSKARKKAIDDCVIEYKDQRDLDDLLKTHLDIAGEYLPQSSLALMHELAKETKTHDEERRRSFREIALLRQLAIHQFRADSNRARAAMSVLLQGWSSQVNLLKMATVDESLTGPLHQLASKTRDLAAQRAPVASDAEGLVPGIAKALAEVHYQACALVAACEAATVGLTDREAITTQVGLVTASIERMQSRLNSASRQIAWDDDETLVEP